MKQDNTSLNSIPKNHENGLFFFGQFAKNEFCTKSLFQKDNIIDHF